MRSSILVGGLAIFALFAVVPFAISAQVDPVSTLLSTKSLKCTFELGVGAEWVDDEIKVETAGYGPPIIIDSIDIEKKSARFIGNIGSTDLILLVTGVGLTFIEETPSGNLNITTVFYEYVSDDSRFFKAVASRHTNFLGAFPQQYYGGCEKWD